MSCTDGSDDTWIEAKEFVRLGYGKPGDLISFNRGMYSHWAIYEGDGNVINALAKTFTSTEGKIIRESLINVAHRVPGKTTVRIDNLINEAKKLQEGGDEKIDLDRSVETQLTSARQMVDSTIPYHIINDNCQHYATEWKFGSRFSTQDPIEYAMMHPEEALEDVSTFAGI